MNYKNQLCPTHNIANNGFSAMRRFVARCKVSSFLTGNHPLARTYNELLERTFRPFATQGDQCSQHRRFAARLHNRSHAKRTQRWHGHAAHKLYLPRALTYNPLQSDGTSSLFYSSLSVAARLQPWNLYLAIVTLTTASSARTGITSAQACEKQPR